MAQLALGAKLRSIATNRDRTMPSLTFTPSSSNPDQPFAPVTGAVRVVFGVRLVCHRTIGGDGKTWQVSEPTTGSSIARGQKTQAAAWLDAERRIGLAGGLGALAHAMAYGGANVRPSATATGGALLCPLHVSAAEFLYGAGGPIDATERIAAGSTQASHFTRVSYPTEIFRDRIASI